MLTNRIRHALLPALACLAAALGCDPPTAPPIAAVGTATKLTFSGQPSSATIGETLSPAVRVEIQDAAGIRVANADGAVTLALGANPDGGTLAGTTTANAVSGVATFSGLSLNKAGIGYTLVAASGGLTSATSTAFTAAAAAAPNGAFAQVVSGGSHACGLTVAGALHCWGYNEFVQVGPVVRNQFAPVHVGGDLTFVQAGLGPYHTCAVTAAGAPYCWGYNSSGQLGDGTSGGMRGIPTLAAGGMTFVQMIAGNMHTCGLTAAGAAYCWGENASGSLGDGTTTTRLTPTLVAGGLTFAGLSTSFLHTCGVTTAGDAYCWGTNNSGQLGDGTLITRTIPGAVTGGLAW